MNGDKLNGEVGMQFSANFEMQGKKKTTKKPETPGARSDDETLKIFRKVVDDDKKTKDPTIVVNPEVKPSTTGPKNPAGRESNES